LNVIARIAVDRHAGKQLSRQTTRDNFRISSLAQHGCVLQLLSELRQHALDLLARGQIVNFHPPLAQPIYKPFSVFLGRKSLI
jgi:hypothetical protein